MPQPENEKCHQCVFWIADDSTATNDRPPIKGECHRYPAPMKTDLSFFRWPVTFDDDWCGEWKS